MVLGIRALLCGYGMRVGLMHVIWEIVIQDAIGFFSELLGIVSHQHYKCQPAGMLVLGLALKTINVGLGLRTQGLGLMTYGLVIKAL